MISGRETQNPEVTVNATTTVRTQRGWLVGSAPNNRSREVDEPIAGVRDVTRAEDPFLRFPDPLWGRLRVTRPGAAPTAP